MPSFRAHVALIYGVTGQTLEFYPPLPEIGPSSGTYSVWRGEDGNDMTALFSGNLTLDYSSVVTTTDAAAGPSQARRNRLPLTSTTGVLKGRDYVVETTGATGGRNLQVSVVGVNTGDSVDLESDLPIEVASGSSFVGHRMSFTVDATFIATVTNINVFGSRLALGPGVSGSTATSAPPYRVRWKYTDAFGIPREHWTTFDVCRAPAQHNVSKALLIEEFPDLPFEEWIGQKGQDFAPQIRSAWDRVKFDIRMAGYDVDMLSQDTEVLDRLTLLASISKLASLGLAPGERDKTAWAEEREAAYLKALNDSVNVTLKAWVQTDASGAIATEPSEQLWFHR